MAPPKLPQINMDRVSNPPADAPQHQHAATARGANTQRQIDMGLLKAAGRQNPANLIVDDLARNPDLHNEFKGYALKDFFDQDGRRRFQNLSLTYAARQQKGVNFGSTSDAHLRPAHAEHASFSARAYHLATEALARDKEHIAARAKEEVERLTSEDKVRVEDVRKRQSEFLFLEVPDYEKYMPPGVNLKEILPPDTSHEQEQGQKYQDERQNSSLDQLLEAQNIASGSIRTEWMLSIGDIAELMKWIQLWNCAARGYNIPAGICRPTFCQFVMDAGLVGTKEVPYHWACSLFDANSRPSRCCPPEASWAPTAAFTKALNRWNLVCVIDKLVRQHCDHKTKTAFFKQMIARLREKLPSKCCEPREIKKVTGTVGPTNARGSILSPRRSSTLEDDDEKEDGSKADDRGSVSGAARKSVMSAASAASSQPWLKPPERPISSVDTGREHLKRDRLVSSMLREPEVLHLMTKYKPLFKSVFDCYARSGKLSFPDFLQFAVNFRFMPRVASTYVLQYMYESVVCLEDKEVVEYRKQKKEKQRVTVTDKDVTSPKTVRGSNTARKTQLSRKTQAKRNVGTIRSDRLTVHPNAKDKAGEEPPASPRSARRTRKVSNGSDPDADSIPKTPSSCQSAATASTAVPESKSSQKLKRGPDTPAQSSLTVTTERLTVDDTLSENGDRAASVNSEDEDYDTIEVRHTETFFGLNAFMEAIMKVSFSYLAFYGNTIQANSSSFAKAVWLITYIHCMFDHFQESRTRHLAEGDIDCVRALEGGHRNSRMSLSHRDSLGGGKRSSSKRGSKSIPPPDIIMPNPFAPKQETLENNVNKGMEQNLKKVLDQVDPQLFIAPPRSEMEFSFPNLEPKPGPGVTVDLKGSLKKGELDAAANRLSNRKEARKMRKRSDQESDAASELASPTPRDIEKRPDHEECAVRDRYCRVCDKVLLANDWGNPSCHGCSAVDGLGLKNMPVHKLLQMPWDEEESATTKEKVEKKVEEYTKPVLEVHLPAGVRPLALNMNLQLSPPPTGEVRNAFFLS